VCVLKIDKYRKRNGGKLTIQNVISERKRERERERERVKYGKKYIIF